MDTAEKLRLLREENNLTLEEVGMRIGVGKSTVRKWEKGMITNIKRDNLKKLADIYGVSLSYLLREDDSFTSENALALANIMKDNKLLEHVKYLMDLTEEHREKIYYDIRYWHEQDM